MAYKMICDKCNKETDKNAISNRAVLTLDGWKAEVVLVSRHDLVLGNQVLCEPCLREILQHGKLLGDRWVA